ncbi:PREDICTED: zinc finger and BTB domain-containing protein 24-like isoform X4 [Polistes dominula]|uniref:Zinc finger and BTB domain-containing protein 24-like isoform X4 n=1 Tax=Polistes dominula TaxID=743375 RepID=A0ABM1IZ30_POLDO|nr:PREDICTED: zinc finger and BTB domain-containing protein 24-like isoform X4 [Polistes dominula]
MNFNESNNIQGTLPQFSEITLRMDPFLNDLNQFNISSSAIELSMAQHSPVYSVATGLNQNKQQIIVNSPNKYPGSLLTLTESSPIMQLYEKQCALNIPNYNQSNASLINVQSNSIPMRIIPNVYLPSMSQIDTSKEENKTDNEVIISEDFQQVFQLQGSNMAEYIQKIQASSIANMPLINLQIMKLQNEQPKEEKTEPIQNNILNIPSVPGFRNAQTQNVSQVKQHRQVHMQERKYQCGLCDAMLKRKEHLDQHMRGHSNKRPFKCSLCEKAFKRNEHLRRHNVIHSGNKNFICVICQKAFARKDHLHKHTQTHLATKKGKSKKDVFDTEAKEICDKTVEVLSMPKQQEINFLMKDSSNLLQHIQHLQKDQLLFTGSSLSITEEALRDIMAQQPFANISENISYVTPS